MSDSCPATKDRILIEDQCIHCEIGLTEQERSFPQRLLISTSVGLENGLGSVASSVDLDTGLCYATLAECFKAVAQARSWTLVEELGEALTKAAFEQFPASSVIELTIKKFVVPETAWVGIRIERRRF